MIPDQAVREAEAGELRPVYLVVGEETFLIDEVIAAIRAAVSRNGIAGFNEDKFNASDAKIDNVLSASRMVPMMAPRRFVWLRDVDAWEAKSDDSAPVTKDTKENPLDRLAEYAKSPVDTTVLVISAQKLHGQRRLVTVAKKAGFIVNCDAIKRGDVISWVTARARLLGHKIDRDAAEELGELSGSDLATLASAIERLSLFVGEGQTIDGEAVAAMVTRVRSSTAWELVDAVAARDLGSAMTTLATLDLARGEELKLLGALAWSVRQLCKFEDHLMHGDPPQTAAQKASVPPFRVDPLRAALKQMPRGTPRRWLHQLAEVDLALKGSRRPGRAVLERLVMDMCH